MSNALYQRIQATDQNEEYDDSCKTVLSAKIFLAHILHNLIKQYSNLNIKKIMQCIDNDIHIATLPVHPNEKQFIQGTGQENTILNEGTVRFDLFFTATHPSHDKIYVNIEAQNSYPSTYAIEQRGFYYTGRMLSSQYGVEFTHSHYESIKECYSIWICLHPPVKKRNTIVQYTSKKEIIAGKYNDKREYKIINVIILNLGDPDEEGIEPILRLLGVLLSSDRNYIEKKEIMEKEFDIKLTEKEEEDFEKMCNLSYGVEQKGINKGKSLGIIEGKTLGIVEGRIQTLTKQIEKIYKKDLKDWLESLSHEQLDKAEDLILERMSYEEFIKQVES